MCLPAAIAPYWRSAGRRRNSPTSVSQATAQAEEQPRSPSRRIRPRSGHWAAVSDAYGLHTCPFRSRRAEL